tara:strand:+ start:3234 stop:6191 length:2958 start_codon:yes stop_codon:yes gene_type:complete
MPRYDKYGPQDDRTLEDLDLGFTGYNNRLRPDQLTRGLLRSSVNGRLDLNGEWQVRKGVENVSAPFTVGGTSLTIPLNLPFTITAASVTAPAGSPANTLTITTSTNHGLAVGDKVVIEGLRYTSGNNPNGEHTTISGTEDATIKITFNAGSAISYTVSDGIAFVGSPPKWDAFPADSVNYGSAADYGELSTHLFLPHAGGSVATTLADATNTEVTASCRFSDNSITTDEFVIMSAVANASAFDTSTSETFDMLFPSGETVPLQSSIIQALNKIIIFRNQQRALECTQFFKALDIVSATRPSGDATVTITTSTSHGMEVGDIIGIQGLSGNVDPNGTITVTTKTSTTFTYEASSSSGADDPYTLSSAKVIPVFQLVQGGDFTQPVAQSLVAGEFAVINSVGTAITSASLLVGDTISLTDASSTGLIIGTDFVVNTVFEAASAVGGSVTAYSVTDTTATITTNTGHGLELHQPITLASVNAAVNGKNVVSGITSETQFTIEIASGSGSSSGLSGSCTPTAGVSFGIPSDVISTAKTQAEQRAATPTFIKRIAQGGGYIHMPFPEYGTYHQKRLVVPHFFNVTGTTTLATTDRKNRDEIIFSDILDTNTYDAIFGQFRFNAGTADFNVGLHSFNEDNLLVFNRNSIHLVSNTISLKNSSVRLLTNEVGCISRKSIQQIGSQVLFLSDNGIYAIEFLDVLNLRGNDIPLSEPIKTNIDLINKSIADKATAVYFDNRYYIALPMDLIQGESVEQVFFSEQEALEYIDPATGKGNTFDASDTSKNLVKRVSATGNNVILIYNFLNKQWESIDYIGASADIDSFNIDGNFDILDLIVSGKGNSRAVYAVNSQGGVHRLDSNVNGVDSVISTIGSTTPSSRNINGFATTRMFNLNSIDRKRFNNFELLAESSVDVSSTFRLGAVTENIDKEFLLNNSSAFNITSGEDVALRGRIGNKRAYGMQFRVQNTSGRPKLKGIKVSAAETFRSTNKAE